MGALESWLQSAVVVAVLLYVWRRIDTRLDRMDEGHRSDMADPRSDLTRRMDSHDAPAGRRGPAAFSHRGVLIGPWRPPADDAPPPKP